jgi:hypothetical protein
MRLPRLSVLTMVFLVAIIAIAFASLRWWLFDPTASRLPVGSVAILEPDEPRSGASIAVYPSPMAGGQWVPVRVRSRVKVLDDSKPSVTNSFTSDGVTVRGDDRDVKITVLDGKMAGFTGYTSRFYLRATWKPW